MVAEEKKSVVKERRRLKISEAIIEAVKIDLPDIIIQNELSRIESQFKNDLEHLGVKLEDYVKQTGKTFEDIRGEWRPGAEKKAKIQLVISAIARSENIKPDQREIEEEVNHIIKHYKDADKEKATVYAETVLTNDKVFEFLEKQAP